MISCQRLAQTNIVRMRTYLLLSSYVAFLRLLSAIVIIIWVCVRFLLPSFFYISMMRFLTQIHHNHEIEYSIHKNRTFRIYSKFYCTRVRFLFSSAFYFFRCVYKWRQISWRWFDESRDFCSQSAVILLQKETITIIRLAIFFAVEKEMSKNICQFFLAWNGYWFFFVLSNV